MKTSINGALKVDILENAPVIIAFHDVQQNVVWANRAYREPAKAELTPENQDNWLESKGSWLARAIPITDGGGQIR